MDVWLILLEEVIDEMVQVLGIAFIDLAPGLSDNAVHLRGVCGEDSRWPTLHPLGSVQCLQSRYLILF